MDVTEVQPYATVAWQCLASGSIAFNEGQSRIVTCDVAEGTFQLIATAGGGWLTLGSCVMWVDLPSSLMLAACYLHACYPQIELGPQSVWVAYVRERAARALETAVYALAVPRYDLDDAACGQAYARADWLVPSGCLPYYGPRG